MRYEKLMMEAVLARDKRRWKNLVGAWMSDKKRSDEGGNVASREEMQILGGK